MAGSTISSTITSPVTLGIAGYASPLSITSKGAIDAFATLATALYVPGRVGGAFISNAGMIIGGTDAGVGIDVSGTGTITNAGTVEGGTGANNSTGGIGIEISNNVTVLNFGKILGGMGGTYVRPNSSITATGPGGTGGAGISISAGLIINYGDISGGSNGTPGTQTSYPASPGYGGVGINAAGTVTVINKGVVTGGTYGGNAINLFGDSYLLNAGTIIGAAPSSKHRDEGRGIYLSGSLASFNNIGLVAAGGIDGYGISINYGSGKNSGTISTTNATYSGTGVGIYAGYFLNSGFVTVAAATFAVGVYVSDSGASHQTTFINTGTVAVSGGGVAVYGGIGLPLIENKNLILGGTFAGIGLLGGTVMNTGSIISNVATGIYAFTGSLTVNRPVTIINSGYIHGAVDAVSFASTISNNVVIVEPHATFSGNVVASASLSDILEVAGTSATVLAGIGTSIVNFQQISFASGAHWAIEGNSAGLAGGEIITGFTAGDTIILDGFAVTSDSYTTNGLVLTQGTSHVTLDITGSFSTASFDVVDPPAETTITVVCYLRGTRIATPAGEQAIEDLNIGDAVITKFGGYRRIKWIGQQSYGRRFIADNFEQIPVKFAACSLGPNLPRRELYVSPGHSMLVSGVLVLAKSLVNGITITQNDCPERLDYFQLEFETHDCVLAEGVWSESYADTPGLRAKFHNAADFYALYPGHVEPAAQWLCAPRPLAGPELEAVLRPLIAALPVTPGPLRGHIDERSPRLIRGWVWDEANPHLPMLLEIFSGDFCIGSILACDYRDDLAKAGFGRGHCSFSFAMTCDLPAERPITICRAQDGAEIHDAATRHLGRPWRAAG